MLTFDLYNAPRIFTFTSETKFEIGALFRLVMLYTDTKTKKQKKNTHHCKINTFFTSFRI
ncbi:hypothetical protein FWK35_00028570 [Aphis craccivora]|uniref:Uncharacterized protein n=1 Tax=Aphis craccivora TaxID=307492 RepID=A0A6G0YG08_APHCR|nr:hypothetical protein FWK35_00028570 [Aphis craccivora]